VKIQCQNLNGNLTQTTGVVRLTPNFVNRLVMLINHGLHFRTFASSTPSYIFVIVMDMPVIVLCHCNCYGQPVIVLCHCNVMTCQSVAKRFCIVIYMLVCNMGRPQEEMKLLEESDDHVRLDVLMFNV
jgi:hypothetical protein